MTIYRVENEVGVGCYRENNNIVVAVLIAKHDNSLGRHPTPRIDKGIDRGIRVGEICGFIDYKQARDWFEPEELVALYEIGYTLKQVEVKEITAVGQKQVLAIR